MCVLLYVDRATFIMALEPERAKLELLGSLQVFPERRNPADLERISEALRIVEPLRRYPSSKLAKVSRIAQLLELRPKDTVFLEGDEGTHFFVLIEGTVIFSKSDTAGQSKVDKVLTDSGWFGESVLLAAHEQNVSNILHKRLNSPQHRIPTHGAHLVFVV